MKKSAIIASALMLPTAVAFAASGIDGASTSSPGMNDTGAPAANSRMGSSFDSDTQGGAHNVKRGMEQFMVSTDETAGPGYTYVQGEYIPTGKLSGEGKDFHGYGADLSYEFPTGSDLLVHPILQGGWHRLNIESSPQQVNKSYVGLGAQGFYDYGGAEGTGIGYYGTVNYERIQFRHLQNNAGPTADGWGITGGLRWMAMPRIEVNPHATYYDYGSISGDGVNWGSPDGFEYGLQLLGYLDQDQHYALTVGYDRSDFDIGPSNLQFHDVVNVGARFTF